MNHAPLLSQLYSAFPIAELGESDTAAVIGFATALDEAGRWFRFHRRMSAETIAAHYRAIDWPTTMMFGWLAEERLVGLAEAFLHDGPEGPQAEIAFSVAPGWRCRGIATSLVSRAAAAAAGRGARCSMVVWEPGAEAAVRIMQNLGASIHESGGIAVLSR